MKLNDRQVAFLVAMQDGRPRNPSAIFYEAFPDAEYRGRRDAGATRTLDAMARLGLVKFTYPSSAFYASGRTWWITREGKDELAERGLLKPVEKQGLGYGINGVPDCPGYVYGLAIRSGALVKVDVCRLKDGRTAGVVGTVEGVGWEGPGGVHALARTLIGRTDGRVTDAG